MESMRSSEPGRRGSAAVPEGEELAELIQRWRAAWLLSDVPPEAAEEMARELEIHLRERLAAGGSIAAVVGTDPSAFAAEWAAERRESLLARLTLLRALSGALALIATYAAVALLVALIGGDQAATVIRSSDLLWLGLLLAGGALATRRGTLRDLALRAERRAAALAAHAFLLGPIAVAITARTIGQFGPTMAELAWPWTLAVVALAAAATVLTTPRFIERHRDR